jgi:hypothetical protein
MGLGVRIRHRSLCPRSCSSGHAAVPLFRMRRVSPLPVVASSRESKQGGDIRKLIGRLLDPKFPTGRENRAATTPPMGARPVATMNMDVADLPLFSYLQSPDHQLFNCCGHRLLPRHDTRKPLPLLLPSIMLVNRSW